MRFRIKAYTTELSVRRVFRSHPNVLIERINRRRCAIFLRYPTLFDRKQKLQTAPGKISQTLLSLVNPHAFLMLTQVLRLSLHQEQGHSARGITNNCTRFPQRDFSNCREVIPRFSIREELSALISQVRARGLSLMIRLSSAFRVISEALREKFRPNCGM